MESTLCGLSPFLNYCGISQGLLLSRIRQARSDKFELLLIARINQRQLYNICAEVQNLKDYRRYPAKRRCLNKALPVKALKIRGNLP